MHAGLHVYINCVEESVGRVRCELNSNETETPEEKQNKVTDSLRGNRNNGG